MHISIIWLGLVFCLGSTGSLVVLPARADGGGPQPTQTLPAAQPTAALLAPSQLDPAFALSPTAEVKSFEIIIDANQNATIQPILPEGQSAISNLQDSGAQASASAPEEEFTSPLWVFGFLTLVIIIVVVSSAAKGLRSRV